MIKFHLSSSNLRLPINLGSKRRWLRTPTGDLVFSAGRRKHKYFQWLTTNRGYPKLREHLGSVTAIMKLSSDWHDFRAKLNRLHPSYKKPTQLSLEFADDEPDTG